MKRIMWCKNCKIYTLKEVCPICGSKTIWKVPPKFSPEDRYGKYRRMLKKELMEKGNHDNNKGEGQRD